MKKEEEIVPQSKEVIPPFPIQGIVKRNTNWTLLLGILMALILVGYGVVVVVILSQLSNRVSFLENIPIEKTSDGRVTKTLIDVK